jgi:hypothetical protein
MSPLDHALRLCQQVPVFPVLESKRPACPHGFKDSSRDPAAVDELWRLYPGPLVGVPTGDASGLDALDIDPRHGGDTWLAEAVNALPVSRVHYTRSGGQHRLFRHAKGVKNSTSKIAPGVDTRGENGYIIWWPAAGFQVENPRIMDDWPRWLLRLLLPRPSYRPPPVPATHVEASSRAALMIERAYGRVRSAAPGQRHYQLRAAAATLGGLLRYLPGQTTVENALVDLIMSTGAEDRRNAEKTAHWALDRGQASPLLGER